jgi:hypothetical protein
MAGIRDRLVAHHDAGRWSVVLVHRVRITSSPASHRYRLLCSRGAASFGGPPVLGLSVLAVEVSRLVPWLIR